MATIELNDTQASAILVEGLARQLYENGGKIPDDPAVRMEDAIKLTNAALAARNNGNKSENVETILFIAQVDQKPEIKQNPTIPHQDGENGFGSMVGEDVMLDTTNFHNGLDLASLSDGVIEGLITGLDKYPPSEQVEADRAAYIAERERRKNAQAQKGQEDSQAEAPGEASQSSSKITDEGSAPVPLVGSEDARSEPNNPAEGEDAGAFARAQTEEPAQKGRKAKAKQNEEVGERSKLEEELTLPMVKAHGIDITKLNALSTNELRNIVENPDGPPAKETKMPVNESEIESEAVPKDSNVVGGIIPGVAPAEQEISKADLNIEVSEDGEVNIPGQASAERDRVESLITGPCLKAYRRGRKEIPSIGINELKLMALYPDAKISTEQLEQARETDSLGKKVVQEVRKVDAESQKPQMIVTKEAHGSEVEYEPQDNQGDAEQVVVVEPFADPIRISEEQRNYQNQNRAMEIIARENMPIPPNYSDEEAPILPMDVSVISRDELFSLHAKFHACESRMLWVMCQEEDILGDIEKLRKNREAIVGANVPFLGEDGKRNTNEYRDFQIASDHEVLSLGEKEHEIKKVVKRLKVLCDNYHRDCERLSRQMSKYERERLDAPR